jgi:predicted metalloprotease with PDZ domain
LSSQTGYHVDLDLNRITDDRLLVTVTLPKLDQPTATFVFPVIAPGTYEFNAWHRLIHNFTAYDEGGSVLGVSRSADSQFVLTDAQRTSYVTYWIDDSFDVADSSLQVFHPAGTDFEDSIVVINHTGIVGYIDGMQNRPYVVNVKRPSFMYCATALEVTVRTDSSDEYVAPSYDALVDGPVLYSVPDTATIMVNSTRVLVALAHHNTNKLAAVYAKVLSKITSAIHNFLGALPVDRYAFLIYLYNGDTVNVRYLHYAQGALEHNFSSMYFWRYSIRALGFNDVAGHEFLHILVPLNLHSEEIDRFNFRTPVLSDHIWLYEGVTEYFAEQVLLRDSITSDKNFIKIIERWASSFEFLPDKFNLISFSSDILSAENQHVYPLIYLYGPLNALLLDVVLRDSSKGKLGLLELVQLLMKQYGQSKPFKDKELFAEIGRVSTPEAQAYCEQYINSDKRLPVSEILSRIGLTYSDSVVVSRLTFGIGVDRKSNDSTIIIYPDSLNPLGVQTGDILLEVNGVKVKIKSFAATKPLFKPETDEPLTLLIRRGNAEIELTAKPVNKKVIIHHQVDFDANATADQVALRNRVFYGKIN